MDLTEIGNGNIHRHPWELSRAQSIIRLLNGQDHETMADIGSGDAYFAGEVCRATRNRIYACDIHYDNLESTLPNITKVASVAEIPRGKIEVAFLLDVLEHVEDEDALLSEVGSLLQENGSIILTVPAFQWLYSEHDSFLKHFRRYGKNNLQEVLVRNDFVVEKIFYFYTSLFCLKAVTTIFAMLGMRKRYINAVSNWKYPRRHPITRLLVFMLNADFKLNRFFSSTLRITLPGLSLCAIARKPA